MRSPFVKNWGGVLLMENEFLAIYIYILINQFVGKVFTKKIGGIVS